MHEYKKNSCEEFEFVEEEVANLELKLFNLDESFKVLHNSRRE